MAISFVQLEVPVHSQHFEVLKLQHTHFLRCFLSQTKSDQFNASKKPNSNMSDSQIAAWWKDMGSLFNDQTTSDFTILVGSKEFHVHKTILSFHSPVFKAMFSSSMYESRNGKLGITDFSVEVVQSFLRCIYDLRCMQDDEFKAEICQLLLIADKYDIQKIMDAAENAISTNLHVGNVVNVLIFADRISRSNIKSTAMRFITCHASEVFNAPEILQSMSRELLNEVTLALAAHVRKIPTGVSPSIANGEKFWVCLKCSKVIREPKQIFSGIDICSYCGVAVRQITNEK